MYPLTTASPYPLSSPLSSLSPLVRSLFLPAFRISLRYVLPFFSTSLSSPPCYLVTPVAPRLYFSPLPLAPRNCILHNGGRCMCKERERRTRCWGCAYTRILFSKCIFSRWPAASAKLNGARAEWGEGKAVDAEEGPGSSSIGWPRHRGAHVYRGLIREWPMKGFMVIENRIFMSRQRFRGVTARRCCFNIAIHLEIISPN